MLLLMYTAARDSASLCVLFSSLLQQGAGHPFFYFCGFFEQLV
jgi:hypothetical protein